MTKPKWRDQRDMNPYKCRKGCCQTSFRICFTRYQCRCHGPVEVAA